MKNVIVTTGISGGEQESSFMNATLQSAGLLGGDEYEYDFSIATYLMPPASALVSEEALASWIEGTLKNAVLGCGPGEIRFEVQVGQFGDGLL